MAMARWSVGNLCAKTVNLRGNAPVVATPIKTVRALGRGALKVDNAVKLTPVKQTTAQKLACINASLEYIPREYSSFSKLVVGATAPADILINVSTISGTHCELTATDDTVLVKDLGSTNGTFIDDDLVSGVSVASPGQTIVFDADKGLAFVVELDASVAKKTPKPAAEAEAEVASTDK